MKFFYFFIFLGVSLLANQTQEEQKIYFQKANELYREKSFKPATVFYEKLLVSNPKNYKLHFNLGNAYYRLSEATNVNQEKYFSKSVFHFKKALSYNKNYQKAYNNLIVLLEEIRDSETLLQEKTLKFFYFLEQISYYLTSWFFFIILIIVVLNIIKRKKKNQNTLPFIFIYALFLSIGLLGKINFNENKAVMSKTTSLQNEPSHDSISELKVNAGSIVFIIREKQIGEWILVEKNGTTGWVKKNDLMDL